MPVKPSASSSSRWNCPQHEEHTRQPLWAPVLTRKIQKERKFIFCHLLSYEMTCFHIILPIPFSAPPGLWKALFQHSANCFPWNTSSVDAAIDNTQINKAGLCSSKFLFANIGSRLNVAFGSGRMAPVPDLEVLSSRSCDDSCTNHG